jgi:excinuclease ABC subunit C
LTRAVTGTKGGKNLACYGPIVGRGIAREAVRRLNDWFKLRDCPSTQRLAFADQVALFPEDRSTKCLRYDIGTCLGPCGGGCTQMQYAANVRAAKAFLDGKDTAVLDALTARMRAAAADLRFEQATADRDRLQALTYLSDRLAFLRAARRANSFVYPLDVPGARPVWYLIHHGEVQAAVREPATADEWAAAAALIRKVFASVPPPGGIDDKCVDSVLLVTSWFRKRADEKAKLLTRATALARCTTEGPQNTATDEHG